MAAHCTARGNESPNDNWAFAPWATEMGAAYAPGALAERAAAHGGRNSARGSCTVSRSLGDFSNKEAPACGKKDMGERDRVCRSEAGYMSAQRSFFQRR
jgi:hypothetical protein